MRLGYAIKMQNKIIELHDSKVQEIRIEKKDLVLIFNEAYIHQSEGRPGRDKGTGWIQKIELRFFKASLDGKVGGLPESISEGLFEIGNKQSDGIPIPFDSKECVRLTIVFQTNNEVQIFGERMELKEVGQAEYVEEFTGN
jgi:hypothetical protein